MILLRDLDSFIKMMDTLLRERECVDRTHLIEVQDRMYYTTFAKWFGKWGLSWDAKCRFLKLSIWSAEYARAKETNNIRAMGG